MNKNDEDMDFFITWALYTLTIILMVKGIL